jgi:hypothetical protein
MQNEIQYYNEYMIEKLGKKLDAIMDLTKEQLDIMNAKNKDVFTRVKDLLFHHEYEKAYKKFYDCCDIIDEINFKMFKIIMCYRKEI